MLQITKASPLHLDRLAVFFAKINTPGIKDNFSPHAFDLECATKICNYEGKDEYYLCLFDEKVIAYGMLRGWDEGYAVPSLGVCVDPSYQGLFLGRHLVGHLIRAAALRGCESLILKVKKHNLAAIHLYRTLGFTLADKGTEYLHGHLSLRR